MKKYLILLSVILFLSCTQEEPVNKTFSYSTEFLPFDFTLYGLVDLNENIKQINDSASGWNYSFNTDGTLSSIRIKQNIYIISNPSLSYDTIITLDKFVYNDHKQLTKVGNNNRVDVYTFEYNNDNLTRIIFKNPVIQSFDTALNSSVNNYFKEIIYTYDGNNRRTKSTTTTNDFSFRSDYKYAGNELTAKEDTAGIFPYYLYLFGFENNKMSWYTIDPRIVNYGTRADLVYDSAGRLKTIKKREQVSGSPYFYYYNISIEYY